MTLLRHITVTCLAAAVLAGSAASAAADGPLVRIDVDPVDVAVGEAVSLTVTVLVPTWFSKPPGFPSFELANAVTRLPPDSSYPISERIDGETWSGIVRQYQVFPLIGAEFRMSDLNMFVTYADADTRSPISVEVRVPEIAFTAAVPAGAEGLDPYVSGSRLSLTRELVGESDALAAGDGLVVRYIAELDGMPSIFLPPLIAAPEIAGASVYVDQPRIEDGPPSMRIDTLTFVFEAGGEFQIPGARLDWWNTETLDVEAAEVNPLTLSVAGPLLETSEPDSASQPVDWSRIVRWAVLIALILWLLSRISPKLKTWADRLREHYVASERYAFRQLRRALHGNDPSRAHRAMLTWLERIDPQLGIREFAKRYADDSLVQQLSEIGRRYYRDSQPVDLRSLERPLSVARHNAKRRFRDTSNHALPPLNP